MLVLDLIDAIIRDEDLSMLAKVKVDYFIPKDQPYIEFVKTFFGKYSKLPDVQTIETQFNVIVKPTSETIDFLYDETIRKYKEHVAHEAVRAAAKSPGDAIQIFQDAIVDSNVEVDGSILHYDAARRKARYQQVKGTGGITYYSTGNEGMDEFSMGYKRADLWTIGGAEGIGKTWYLIRMADWLDQVLIEVGSDQPILFISCEMDGEEIEDRADCISCGIPYGSFLRGQLTGLQERKYNMFVDNRENSTNIKVIDTFDNMSDVEYFISIYNPAAVYIDGMHLMASSYDWQDVAQITAKAKKITRNKKTPIINTTHLKAKAGTSDKGGSLDDFAYTKGFTRDSDMVALMFQSEDMALSGQIGLDWLKVRRGQKLKFLYQQDFVSMEFTQVAKGNGSVLDIMQNAADGQDVDLYS